MSEETCPDCGRAHRRNRDWRIGDCAERGAPDCLRSQLSAATARASELERELAVSCDALDLQADKRDKELVAMGERVARLESCLVEADELAREVRLAGGDELVAAHLVDYDAARRKTLK